MFGFNVISRHGIIFLKIEGSGFQIYFPDVNPEPPLLALSRNSGIVKSD